MKMNFNQELSKDTIRGMYEEQHDYLVPISVIIVSVLLFFVFLLPQIASFPLRKTEVDNEQKKLKEFKSATTYAQSVNSAQLNSELLLTAQVLPADKDYEGVLSAVSQAANAAGVTIGDFQFLLAGPLTGTEQPITNIPAIGFDVNVSGTANQVLMFANELYKTAPISDISAIDYANNNGKVSAIFYYKPFPSADIQDGSRIRAKNADEQSTFGTISQWTIERVETNDIQVVPAQDASESAATDLPF